MYSMDWQTIGQCRTQTINHHSYDWAIVTIPGLSIRVITLLLFHWQNSDGSVGSTPSIVIHHSPSLHYHHSFTFYSCPYTGIVNANTPLLFAYISDTVDPHLRAHWLVLLHHLPATPIIDAMLLLDIGMV
jgi:hypothetical protein